ncbi:lytic murein transglycosylase [Micromonospora musae]|uniref:lytic murein transglycosylase n=1 Tax=Micromonospora musae TaxID=1894970 RepID=UPI00341C93B6
MATPTIVGRALDGHGVARIPDTDHGRLDGDTTWDHAVGPLQFTPATWATHAQDGNRDGVTDINNIDDAALAAAGYLCRSGDLTVARNWIAAVTAYNPDPAYTNKVAAAANSYAPAG